MREELVKAKPVELILASKSPFRAQLLANAGITAEICGANIDEREIEASFSEQIAASNTGITATYPSELALKLAKAKAKEVSHRFSDAAVIGCDQILELNGQVLHKVANEEEAITRLAALSGKTHKLQSAYAIVKQGKVINGYVATAELTMRDLSQQQIQAYLRKAENDVLSSVGVYQIEGTGIQLFEKIVGDYWAIIGLPLLPILHDLRQFGLVSD